MSTPAPRRPSLPQVASTAQSALRPTKRSFTIAGHRTSISLEGEFWTALRDAAASNGQSVAALVAAIDRARGEANLSSAIRVWLLRRAREAAHGPAQTPLPGVATDPSPGASTAGS